MDQDRWKTVNHIFHAALEVPANERHVFVATASNGDHELQAEVEVLLKADQNAGSYLEKPLVPEELISTSAPPLNPGEVLCGRFRILRAVGEGGMGHVFEAYDSELAVHIALKVIRPEIASNPEALARFRQEVRLARRITHPNVCRTFDIEHETRISPTGDKRQEFIFLTMEFLEGETLHSRIKRMGALPLEEALKIALQALDALFAAHTLGIIHRDMKPANIMLVPTENSADHGFRAVITDFGLARLDTVVPQGWHSEFSHSGRPIGTLAYMAPEQLEGTAVSAATDIYAFGLILFEMVTGTRAFPSDNFLSGIARRLTGAPPLPQSIIPDLPLPWCRAIEGCLRLRPADRFASATDVIAVLDGRQTNLPPVTNLPFVQRVTFASWPARRRFVTLAGIFFVTVALFCGGYRLYRTSADSHVNPGALVYLTQVKNLSDERSLGNLTELLKAGLEQSAQINLLDQSRVGDTLQLMTKAPETAIDQPLAREIAMRTGAVRVVFATVTGSSGNYKLDVDIQKPDAESLLRPREHWNRTIEWTTTSQTTSTAGAIPRELLTAVRNTSDWIRSKVGESGNDIAQLDAAPEDVTTGSWAALEAYERGEELSRDRRKEDAVVALRNAVAIDPEFATAYGRMGDIEISLGHSVQGYAAYDRAMQTGLDHRLTRRELDRIRGIYASDSWDYDAAQEAFRDYTVFYPNDFRGWFYRALPLMRLGRYDEAVATLDRVEKLVPSNIYVPFDAGLCALKRGDIARAKKWAEELRRRGDADGPGQLAGIVSFLSGDHTDAAREFESMRQAKVLSLRLKGYALLARLWAEQDDPARALEEVRAGETEAAAQGSVGEQGSFAVDEASLLC